MVDMSKLHSNKPDRGDREEMEFTDWRSLDAKGFRSSKSDSYIFKSVLTSRFAKSLRTLGSQRLVQLTNGSGVEDDRRQGDEAAMALDLPDTRQARAQTPQTGSRKEVPELSRVSSAPSLARPQGAQGASRKPQKGGEVLAYLPQKWGPEAPHRFRIYAAAGIDKQELQVRRRPDPGQIMPYKCKLCLRLHKLCPGHDILQ